MKATQWLAMGGMIVCALGLVYCGKPTLVADNSTITEEAAQVDLESRLEKTREIQLRIKGIRDAIDPIKRALRDLGKAIDLHVDERPGQALAGLLDRLETVLKESTSGLIEHRGQGRWALERPNPLSCDGGRVRLDGRPIERGEEFVVSLSECTAPEEFMPIAELRAEINGERHLVISASAIDSRHRETIDLKPCTLYTNAARHVHFSCKPLRLRSGENRMVVDRLEYVNDATGRHANVHVRISHPTRGELGTAELTVKPGKAPVIRVCTQGESCAE